MPSEDERTLAALAHASIILNIVSLGGIVAAAVIWATQRRRSVFVAQHALQALVFQGLGLALTLLGGLGWGGCMLLGLLPVVMRPDLYRNGPPIVFWVVLVAGLLLMGFVLAGVLYAAIAATQAWRGLPFRYIVVGQLIARQSTHSGASRIAQTTAHSIPVDPYAPQTPNVSPVSSAISVPAPPANIEQPPSVRAESDSSQPPP